MPSPCCSGKRAYETGSRLASLLSPSHKSRHPRTARSEGDFLLAGHAQILRSYRTRLRCLTKKCAALIISKDFFVPRTTFATGAQRSSLGEYLSLTAHRSFLT